MKSAADLIEQGKPHDAIPVATEAVELCRKLFGSEHVETALALHQLAYCYTFEDSYRPALMHNQEALAIRRKVLGDKHPHTAVSLKNLGVALGRLDRFKEALACHQEALAIYTELSGEESIDAALEQENVAAALTGLKDFAGARAYSEKAVATMAKSLGADAPQTMAALRQLGDLLIQLKEYDKAEPILEKGYVSLPKEGEKYGGVISVMRKMAESQQRTQDLAGARRRYEEALALCDTRLEKPVMAADILGHLTIVAEQMEDKAAALRYAEQGATKCAKAFGANHDRTIVTVREVGSLYLEMHDFKSAQSWLQKALALQKDATEPNLQTTLGVLGKLASLSFTLGDNAATQGLLERKLAAQIQAYGEKQPETAAILQDLGFLLRRTGKSADGRKCLERALAIQREVFDPRGLEVANTLCTLGLLSLDLKEFDEARSYFQEELAIRREGSAAVNPRVAMALDNLAFVEGMQGKYAAAVKGYQEALDLRRQQAIDDEDPTLIGSFNGLAIFAAAEGAWADAAHHEDQSRRRALTHVTKVLATLPEREQLRYLNEVDMGMLQAGLSLALRQRTNPEIAALSAGWVLNGKSMTEELLADRIIRARESNEPALRQIAQKLVGVRSRQAQLAFAAKDGDANDAQRKEISQLASTEESLSYQLATAGSKSLTGRRWIEVEQLRQALAPGDVYIDIARFPLLDFDFAYAGMRWRPEHYAAWIVPAAGHGNVKLVDLGEAEAIDRAIVDLRVSIKTVFRTDAKGHLRPLDERADKLAIAAFHKLSQLVLHPLVREIGVAEHLIISPDSGLWLVPWAALILPNGQFTVELVRVSHVVSGRELVAPKSKRNSNQPLIVANPNFDLPPDEANSIAKAVLTRTKINPDARKTTRLKPPSPPLGRPLEDFAQQVQDVAPKLATYAGQKPAVLQGDRALEPLVKAVHGPQLMLLATHGFFEPPRRSVEQQARSLALSGGDGGESSLMALPDNPLLHCGLLLAGCNWRNTARGDDGILTGMEILGIDLRGTELVVLSACDTGVGRLRTGEGVANVRQAFRLAGAEAVVSTLWPVLTIEANQQMSEFFAQLAAGRSKVDALRDAQLAAIKRLRAQYNSAPPLVWAAFTLTGRGR
ncbi:MAG TPA: CHAT domain-containing tetratricopeptide repeat protein [Pirellulales bacterium]|jgi:CHAT domain-containing protein